MLDRTRTPIAIRRVSPGISRRQGKRGLSVLLTLLFSACVPESPRDAQLDADRSAGGNDASSDAFEDDSAALGSDASDALAGTPSLGDRVKQISAGGAHSCALFTSGKVRCWGNGAFGRLGYRSVNNVGDNELPSKVGDVNLGGDAIQIAAGQLHTCAILSAGQVRCWGDAEFGQLGYASKDNNIGDDELPSSVGPLDVGSDVREIAAGLFETCAVLSNGKLRCWGNLSSSIRDIEAPADVIQVRVGLAIRCAILSTGRIHCWADPPVEPLFEDLIQLAVSGFRICALLATRRVQCWNGSDGVIDVDVGTDVMQIALGESHTCALLAARKVRCWGSASYGQLGYGNKTDLEAPPSVDVSVGGDVVQIAAGSNHTCALLANGGVRCWGLGTDGQLGYGNTNNIGDDELPSAENRDVILR